MRSLSSKGDALSSLVGEEKPNPSYFTIRPGGGGVCSEGGGQALVLGIRGRLEDPTPAPYL